MKQDIQVYAVSPTRQIFTACLFLVGGLAVLVGAVAVLQAVWNPLSLLMHVILIACVILVPGGLVVAGIYQGYLAFVHMQEDVTDRREQRRRENEMHAVSVDLSRRTVHFDDQGNAALYGVNLLDVVQLHGQYREHPNLTSIHNTARVSEVKNTDPIQAALPPGGLVKPTLEEAVQYVKRNAYEFVLGRSLQSRELILANLEGTHLKVIGGTQMGKSCNVASILDQLRMTHDRQHLLLVLLDLENKTSRLFADDPHVMTIDTGLKKIKMHATTPEQVAEQLILLHQYQEYRYELGEQRGEAYVAALPKVVIYFEEFLYWKRKLANLVKNKKIAALTLENALTAFDGIATRGLKVGLHLIVCAQVDYRDEDLVEAMNQFIGLNMAFCVKPSAAQAAGFVSTELVKRNFEARQRGQFVVEQINGADLGMSIDYDVKGKLQAIDGPVVESDDAPQSSYKVFVSEEESSDTEGRLKLVRKPEESRPRNSIKPTLQAKLEAVINGPAGETMQECIQRVWNVRSGASERYQTAKSEYNEIQEFQREMVRLALDYTKEAEAL